MRMIMRFLAPVTVGVLMLHGQACAVDMSVFGLTLGSKFNVPECEKRRYGTSVFYSPAKVVCFERISDRDKNNDTPIANDTIMIRFPVNEQPKIVLGLGIMGLVLDSKLEGIGFNTFGISRQDRDLSVLKQKYGEPTTLSPQRVQNHAGAVFDALDATWRLPDLEIQFQSAGSRIDTGLVNIDTKKGAEHREQRLREITKDKRPL